MLYDMVQVDEVLEAALTLTLDEREALIQELAATLDASDLGEYWEAEIQRRIADVESGTVRSVPADEVFARLERHFRAQ